MTGISAKDPVCGMDVKPDSSYRFVHDGTEYLFCSGRCLAKFSSEPEKFLKKGGNQAGSAFMAMLKERGIEVQPAEPAAAQLAGTGAAVTRTGTYTCLMHPE